LQGPCSTDLPPDTGLLPILIWGFAWNGGHEGPAVGTTGTRPPVSNLGGGWANWRHATVPARVMGARARCHRRPSWKDPEWAALGSRPYGQSSPRSGAGVARSGADRGRGWARALGCLGPAPDRLVPCLSGQPECAGPGCIHGTVDGYGTPENCCQWRAARWGKGAGSRRCWPSRFFAHIRLLAPARPAAKTLEDRLQAVGPAELWELLRMSSGRSTSRARRFRRGRFRNCAAYLGNIPICRVLGLPRGF